MGKDKLLPVLIISAVIIGVASVGYTGVPPAPIWSEFQAISDVAMNGFNINNADTITANNEIQADTPTSNQSLSTKLYVDNKVTSYLPDEPATSDVDMNSNSIQNADTVDVETNVTYPDGTTQTTSPENCSSGEYLNTNGCESDASGGNGGSDTIPITAVSPSVNLASGETWVIDDFNLPKSDTLTIYQSSVRADTVSGDTKQIFDSGVIQVWDETDGSEVYRDTDAILDKNITGLSQTVDTSNQARYKIRMLNITDDDGDSTTDAALKMNGKIQYATEQ